MLLTLVAILVILWLLGVTVHVGSLIYLLLLVAAVVLVYDLLVNRRR